MKEIDENTENLFENLKKGHPFRVPEGYFETFADRLKVRIEEEEHQNKKRSLSFYLKPVLMMAASFLLVMLLISVPIRKFFPPGKSFIAQQQMTNDSDNSDGTVSANFISYFTEAQFMSAVSEMNELETDTLSTDKLADYIAANYSDYDIIANN